MAIESNPPHFPPDGVLCRTEEETRALGRSFGAVVKSGAAFSLEGPLGAGKTQFVKGLALGLGIGEGVSSPTFALVHEYASGRLPLAHFDLYRLESADELRALGWEEYAGHGVLAIEWGDKFPASLPPGTLRIRFELLDGGQRRLTGSLAE
jgi:tRNA threonylcarbamoyladenosine biosynthesis protein TsaE